MTQAFEDLLYLLSDEELACYIKELSRANDTGLIFKLIIDESQETPLHVLLASFDFKETYQGSEYWKQIFNRISKNYGTRKTPNSTGEQMPS